MYEQLKKKKKYNVKNFKACFQKVDFHHSLMWRIKKLTIF